VRERLECTSGKKHGREKKKEMFIRQTVQTRQDGLPEDAQVICAGRPHKEAVTTT